MSRLRISAKVLSDVQRKRLEFSGALTNAVQIAFS